MRFFSSIILLIALIASASAYKLIPRGGDCTKRPNKCEKGLFCIGPDHAKRCKPFVQLGKRCGQDPYWVCDKGLVCQWRCRIAKGAECTRDPNWCARGLHCVGTKNYKRCEKPVTVGNSCLFEPWWVCASGLTCQHSKCRISQGYECTSDPYWCAKGLQCVGTKYYKQCEKPIKVGGNCLIEPWWVCASGLTCEHKKCRITEGEECTKTPGFCAKGLKCVGTNYRKQCEKPVQAGGSCGIEPYWVCDHGLTCQNRVCRIPRGGDCTNKDYCANGLSCVGPAQRKRCEYPLPIGKPCTGPYDFCSLGLVCGGLGSARRCIDGGNEGRPCRIGNPKMQCDAGLNCVKGFCRNY